jgi:predicted O-methyltransferase YrrM
MDTLDYIYQKYNIAGIPRHNAPIVLPVSREELAELFYELEYIVGAEIGVAEGYYSEVLCKANPKLRKLYCVDVWLSYPGYNDFGAFRLGQFYSEAKKRLEPYNCELVKGFSMDVVEQFTNKSLDFVYIDAAHDFLNVTQDIAKWSKKVRSGGIVAGHDYKRDTNPNWDYAVKDVVPAWIHAHRITPWFIIPGDTSSWMWVVK